MPLDPQVRKWLQAMEAAGLPPLTEMTPQEARAQLIEASAALGSPAPVHHVEDRQVNGPQGPFAVRVYRPSDDAPLPAVLYFHGGGWVTGSIDTHDGFCRELANASGMVVASVDYHLAPEHKFSAAAEEAHAALNWLAVEAAALGIDASRIAVAGDSAGGNLAAVVALLARDRGTPQPACQALFYPITDSDFDTASYREFATGYFLTRDAMRWFWDHYVSQPDDALNPYASPLRSEDLSGLPPALVLTAEYDPLRDEGEAYARRLSEAGVDVVLRRCEGMIHGFLRRTAMLSGARSALARTVAFLRDQLTDGG